MEEHCHVLGKMKAGDSSYTHENFDLCHLTQSG